MNLAKAVYEKLVIDNTLKNLLGTYEGKPAIFTIDPAPGDAVLPYVVASTISSNIPRDSKLSRGREIWIDVRCYTHADGSAALVNTIAERVRYLLHRQPLLIDDHLWERSNCTGPISADESDAYGRVVTLQVTAEEL
jgi:hypothetical protein